MHNAAHSLLLLSVFQDYLSSFFSILRSVERLVLSEGLSEQRTYQLHGPEIHSPFEAARSRAP